MLLLSVPTILLFAADNAPLNVALIGMQSSKKQDELSSTEYRLFPATIFDLLLFVILLNKQTLYYFFTQPSDINSNLWVEGIQ